MKKIEDLTINDVIHCPTYDEWKRILELNKNNTVHWESWRDYGNQTIYSPKERQSCGGYGSVSNLKVLRRTIHKAKDFLKETKQEKEGIFDLIDELIKKGKESGLKVMVRIEQQ